MAIDPNRVAAILAFASTNGDKAACKKFKISRSTLFNYRRRRAADSNVDQICTEMGQKALLTFAYDAAAVRSSLLRRIHELANRPDAKLSDVATAFEKVSGEISAKELFGVDGEGDRETSRSEGASREDQGPAGPGETSRGH